MGAQTLHLAPDQICYVGPHVCLLKVFLGSLAATRCLLGWVFYIRFCPSWHLTCRFQISLKQILPCKVRVNIYFEDVVYLHTNANSKYASGTRGKQRHTEPKWQNVYAFSPFGGSALCRYLYLERTERSHEAPKLLIVNFYQCPVCKAKSTIHHAVSTKRLEDNNILDPVFFMAPSQTICCKSSRRKRFLSRNLAFRFGWIRGEKKKHIMIKFLPATRITMLPYQPLVH